MPAVGWWTKRMEFQGLNWLLLTVLIASKSSIIHGRDVFVSNRGIDTSGCGKTMYSPCKTLQHVTRNQYMYGDKTLDITLDGGKSQQMIYCAKRAFHSSSNLRIKKMNGSMFDPLVKSCTQNGSVFSTGGSFSMKFIGIQFLHISFHRVYEIHFKYCNFRRAGISIKSSFVLCHSLIFENCTLNLQKPLDFEKVWSTKIENSMISQTQLIFKKGFELFIDNSIFWNNGLHFSPISSYRATYFTVINITNSKFENHITNMKTPILYIQNTFLLNIESCTFNHCSMRQIGMFSNVKWTKFSYSIISGIWCNNTQTENVIDDVFQELSVLHFEEGEKALFSNVRFISNTLYGNVITSTNAYLKCSNLSFIDNRLYTDVDYGNVYNTFIFSVSHLEASDIHIANNFVSGVMKNVDRKHNVYLRNITITENNFSAVVFVDYSADQFTLENTSIHNNSYAACMELQNSNIKLKNVSIRYNEKTTYLGVQSSNDFYLSSNRRINIAIDSFTIYSLFHDGTTVNIMPHVNSNITVNKLHIYQQSSSSNPLLFRQNNSTLNFTTSITCFESSRPNVRSINLEHSPIYEVLCNICADGKYSLTAGNAEIDFSNNTAKVNQDIIFRCNRCPSGATCKLGKAISRGNHYGFKDTDNKMKYISCPRKYCCSNEQECRNQGSCAVFRRGNLCGICKEGFQESFFLNSKCIRNSNCSKQWLFWALFFATLIVIIVGNTYLEDCISLIKFGSGKLVSILLKLWKSMKSFEDKEEESRASTQINLSKCKENSFSRSNLHLDTQSCMSETSIKENSSDLIESCSSPSNYCCRPTPFSDEDERVKDDVEGKTYTISGIFSILISFYQVKSLLDVVKIDIGIETPQFIQTISRIFNVDVLFQIDLSLCPILNLDAVTKIFIKDFLFNLLMPIMVLFGILIYAIDKNVKKKQRKNYVHSKREIENFNYRFIHRLCIGYIRLLLIVYKNLALFSLTMLNCVQVKHKTVLFIQGNKSCYQNWQYCVMVFFAVWVVPFPIALWQSYKLFIRKKVSLMEMLVCLTIPMTTTWYFYRARIVNSDTHEHNIIMFEKLQEMFSESYRLKKNSSKDYIFWHHWSLIQRLILAAIATFYTNPLLRVCYMTPCIMVFTIIYFKVRPFKPEFKVLHWCEAISLITFCYLLVANCFYAFLHSHDISKDEPVPSLLKFFMWMDGIFSPLTVLIIYFIFIPLFNKISNIIKQYSNNIVYTN